MPSRKETWSQDDEDGGEEFSGLLRHASQLPLGALAACALYLPGVVLWAVFAIRTKQDTAAFFNTVAPVSSSTLDAADNAVLTTLITLVVGCSLIFLGALALACARSAQINGRDANSCCPCAHPTPSSYYLYSIFNLGFNTIVFLVNLAIVFLLMGAFMWLVVAYAANQAIKYGVRDAASLGTSPSAQLLNATRNLTTVVTKYEQQIGAAPACISNSTWLSTLNSSINGILRHPDDESLQSTILCPYTCLNLGSFATLFKLPYNCICDQEKLETMQRMSAVTSTDAGVALGGLILIYFACCMLHANLTAQFVHSRHDFDEAVRQRRLRRRLGDTEAGLGGSGKGGSSGGYGSSGGGGSPEQQQPQHRLRRFSSGARGGRGSSGAGGGGSSRRQVAPQESGLEGAGAADPGAQLGSGLDGAAPAADADAAAAQVAAAAVAAAAAAAAAAEAGVPTAASRSPDCLRVDPKTLRANSDTTPRSTQLAAAAALARHSYRGQGSSGTASPLAGALPLPTDAALWPAGDEAALAAPHPPHPRHRPAGSAGSARDILLGRVALDSAGGYGGGGARAAVQRPGTSVSASSSLAARHTPSSSQESVSAESPQLAVRHGLAPGNNGDAAVWRPQHLGSGGGRWQTIEGLEEGQAGGLASPGTGEVTSQPQQQPLGQQAAGPQHQQQQQPPLWAGDVSSSGASPYGAAATSALVGLSDPTPSLSPLGLASSMPSPWRPGSSGGLGARAASAAAALPPDGDAAHLRASVPRTGQPRAAGAMRHGHSLSASLPVGGTLSEWAEVHDPAPAPLYSPHHYYGGGPGAGSLASNTPSSSGGPPGMPSVLESGGSTASSDTGRPASADQQHGTPSASLVGPPHSPMLGHTEAERLRGSYRSMRKGLMAYDQYKQRHRWRPDSAGEHLPPLTPPPEQQQQQQQQQSAPAGDSLLAQPQQQQQQQPVDPRLELTRRYRNRVPAI